MVNYLNAELYKVIHRRAYTFGTLAFVLGGVALLHYLFCVFVGDRQTSFETSVSALNLGLVVGPYLSLLISDLVYSDQYKINTMKNEVSYGLPRGRIYLGKLAAAILTAVGACLVIVAFYLALSAVLFPVTMDLGETLGHLGRNVLAAFPVWLGALGFAMMLLFATKGATLSVILFILAMGPLDSVLQLFQLFVTSDEACAVIQTVRDCLLANGFNDLIRTGTMELAASWKLGMAWFLISTIIGLVVFQKREIN